MSVARRSKFGASLARVAELPGKLRLDEATDKAAQMIYFPGFTLVGIIGELGGIIAMFEEERRLAKLERPSVQRDHAASKAIAL